MWHLKNKTNGQTKQHKIQRNRIDWWLSERREVGEVGEMVKGDQEVHTSSYKIIKSWGYNEQHREFSQ